VIVIVYEGVYGNGFLRSERKINQKKNKNSAANYALNSEKNSPKKYGLPCLGYQPVISSIFMGIFFNF